MALYRKTNPATYANVNANNFTDVGRNWRKHSNMYRKTSGNETASLTAVPGRYTDATRTWRRIKAMYRFNGYWWDRIFYKNANQPFATQAPTVRYDAYLGDIVDGGGTDATAWWATDPAQPQWAQMGPGPLGIGQSTWYLNATDAEVGSSSPTYLWGRDGLWANAAGASTSATFVYNTTPYNGNATASTDDEGNYAGDKLKNNEAVMGTYDGYYVWYKIFKTVGQYTGLGYSQSVYITKQEPVINYFTMTSPGTATVGTAKTVNFSFSNKWWRSIDRYDSNIEWHELSSSTQTPDASTLKATHPIYSTTYSVDSATTFSGTDEYVPVGSNKYIYARINYKNTWTEFPPITSKSEEVQTTVATQQACGPFTLSNATKGIRYYDSGSSSWKRTVTVDIGQSASADRYELQIRGYGPWNGSTDYYFPVFYYTTLLTYDQSPYTMESGRSGGVLTATANVADYQYYEITARAKFGGTTDGSVISTNTLYPSGVAPSSPSISSIATTADYFGTYITFNIYQSSFGSNAEKYYEYSLNGGSFSQISTGTYGTLGTGYINQTNGGKIYVAEGTYYTVQVRAVNYDGETSSSSNSLAITSSARPGAPTNVVVKSFAANSGHVFFTSGSNTASMNAWLEYDSFQFTDSIQGYVNINSNTAGVIALSGANSTTRSYTSYLRPYLSSNKTGAEGSLTAFSSKVLNGNDNPTVTISSPTKGTNGSYDINVSWTGAGSSNKYIVDLIQYNSPYSTIATKTTTSSSASFTSADSTQPNTIYYVRVTPIYEYATNVSYTGSQSVSSNITTDALAATAPTSVTSAHNNSADSITITWSGATNATKYRIYWNSNGLNPGSAGTYWDEEKIVDGSTITSTGGSWTWGPNDKDKNNFLPTGRNAQYFMVSATSNGTTWTSYVVTSSANGPYILPVNTAIPTLSGTAKVGQTITYGPGTWDIYPGSYEIELYRGTKNVARFETRVDNASLTTSSNPLSDTYTVVAEDVGYYLRAFATATNYAGTSGWAGGVETAAAVLNVTLYKITFDSKSGTSVSALSQTSEGGSIAKPTDPTRTNFDFLGWSTTDGGSTSVTWPRTPGSNETLYARWTSNVKYKITFDSQSGTAVSALTQATVGGSIAKPTDPTRTDYSFGGWATTSSGTSAVSWPRTPSADETLYAIWSAATSYTITYSGNGNTGGTAPASQTTSGSVTTRAVPALTRTNCDLGTGWNTAADGSGTNVSASASYTPTANITLYAKWTAKTVTFTNPTVSFNGTTGSGSSTVRYWSWTAGGVTNGTATGYQWAISSTNATSGFGAFSATTTATTYQVTANSARWLKVRKVATDGLGATQVSGTNNGV
jgi:uncharacterized repeat protein (TIGR02543 family)